MKKLLYSLFALAALTLAAGCKREKAIDPAEGPVVDVSFNVGLQGLKTKADAASAFSDGTKANDLYVLVYANRTEGSVLLQSVSKDMEGAFADGLTTTVTLRLVRGENYHIVFWAQAPEAPYALDKEAGTITVTTKGLANDDLRDAFYGVWTGTPVSAPQDVELHRPLAQINILTTVEDWEALAANDITFAGSSLTMNAPSVLNLLTGEAGTPVDYEFAQNAIDVDAVNIPGYERTHKYVAMNYVLAGERNTQDLTFGVYRDTDNLLFDFDVPNVPYQRNWRTIIKGNVFSLDGEFNVTIVPDYEGDIDVEDEDQPNDGTLAHPFTVAEVIQFIDDLGDAGTISEKEVYVKGIIQSVKYTYSANFGTATFNMVDSAEDTDFFQAYQILYLGNKKWVETDKWNVAKDDEVVVCGKVMLYTSNSGETYETYYKKNEYNGYLYSLNGKTEETEDQGSTYTVSISDSIDKGSVSLTGESNEFKENDTVTLSVTPESGYELNTLYYNEDGIDNAVPIEKDQTGAYSFKMPANNVTIFASFKLPDVPAGDGSLEHPFTVAEVRDYIDGLNGAVSENAVYVAGIISSIPNDGQFTERYGNASFFISDDGKTTSDQFEAFRVLYLGNQKWVEGDATVAVGDEVVIYGKVKLYTPSNGDPVYETHQSSSPSYNGYLYSLNGQTEIVNNRPVITADNISGVPAAGITGGTANVSISNIEDGGWTVRCNCDGTVVTDATWNNGTLTYSVAANTGAARRGSITIYVVKDNDEVSKEITVSQLAGDDTPSSEVDFSSNVTWTAGNSCQNVKLNVTYGIQEATDVAGLKFGTGTKYATSEAVLPKGTKTVSFFALAWKDIPATVRFTVGEQSYDFSVEPNAGIQNNSPFTVTIQDSDKYSFTLDSALESELTVTVGTVGDGDSAYVGKRAVIFGVHAE